jgi:hypothetical protein
VPDLSLTSDIDQFSDEQLSRSFPQLSDQPARLESIRRLKRLSAFWENATLTDDLGSHYQWASGDAGSADSLQYKGHEAFSPSPPPGARELTVHVHDLAITIALIRT